MIFRFKEFELDQRDCAMKVGTDGVLLGAWCPIVKGRALDIGTGTGLLALMLAQRNPSLIIDAIEIDNKACKRAELNFLASPWSNRLTCTCGNALTHHFVHKYDLIVCNPPYFVDSTKAGSPERTIARHTDSLSFEALTELIVRLLSPSGKFVVVLPASEGEQLKSLALSKGLFLNRQCNIYPSSQKPVKRLLMEFSYLETSTIEESLVIEGGERHNYTKEYISLTKQFYLNF